MDIKTTLWTLALCAGLTVWLYWDVNSMRIYEEWHNYLVDPRTGAKVNPVDVIYLAKIIKYTDDYINSTNAMERLYDREFNHNLENPYTLEQSYSNERDLELSGWPVANQTECSAHLDWIHEQLRQNETYQLVRGARGYELTQMLDSFGRPESGLYAGTLTWVGSYKGCLATGLDGGRIRMRYCQARLRPEWWPVKEPVHPKSRIKMGICVPETCDTSSFQVEHQRRAIDALIRLELPQFLRQNLHFDSMFCLPDERSPIRQLPRAGYIYLLVLGSWLALVVIASVIYEVRKYNERRRIKSYELAIGGSKDQCAVIMEQVNGESQKKSSTRLLGALSVHNSIKSFKSNAIFEQKLKLRVHLGPLNFVKFLLAILIVLGHSSFMMSVFSRSIGNRFEFSQGDLGRVAYSLGRLVDTFFMFFGLLASYMLLKKCPTSKLTSPLTWLVFNINVMMRVTPLLMLVYWYARVVSPYTGSGPWWDYGVFDYSLKGVCLHEPWWKSIAYFSRFGSIHGSACVGPAWFLTSYAHIALLIPLMTYLFVKLPSHLTRYLLLAFIAFISCAQFAIKVQRQVSFKVEDINLLGALFPNLVEKFQSIGGLSSIGRVSCVSIGCYVGYLLRMYEVGNIKEWPKWLASKWMLVGSVAMHAITICLPLIGDRLSRWTSSGQPHITTMSEFLVSYSITTIMWPIINAIVTIHVVTLYNRKAFIRFLCHPVWHAANKLGLAIYLIHWEVMSIGSTIHEHAPSMGFLTDVMKMWAFGVFYSIILAFLIFILFEAPISALFRLLTDFLQAQAAETNQSSSEIPSSKRTGRTGIELLTKNSSQCLEAAHDLPK